MEQSTAALFAAQAQKTPAAVALRFQGESLTYAQLAGRANQLAALLRQKGLGPNSRVALVVKPGFEGVVALLGALAAQVTYVPLDPEAPAERLAFMLAESKAALLLTQKSLVASLPSARPETLCLDDAWATGLAESPVPLRDGLGERVAYVIFTSGSTGEPKGVMVPQRALTNHNVAIAKKLGLGPNDAVLQFTPLHFDAAGEEIFPPLISGSSLVMRGELVPHLEFKELIEREKLTVLSLPPAYLHAWLTEFAAKGVSVPKCIRVVLLGGEKLLPESRTLWDRAGGAQVPWFNVYGPTEATITASLCEIRGPKAIGDRPVMPIGVPLDGAGVQLLDEHGKPVPEGEAGELYISGLGLAHGYLNRPDMSAARFVPDAQSKTPGARLYRTGDLARRLPDGNLEFLGRVDHQVKLRGQRIELGEVENVLRTHPKVQDAVVVLREDVPGDPRLVAYVVTGQAEGTVPDGLRDWLLTKLPEYMVPSASMVLARLPLTSNGKVDRKALPVQPAPTASGEGKAQAKNDIETKLAAIWCEVLSLPEVAVNADFFVLGGHSLAAIQVASRIEDVFGVQIDIKDLFEVVTIEGLAVIIAKLQGGAAGVDVNALSDDQVDAMLKQLKGQQ